MGRERINSIAYISNLSLLLGLEPFKTFVVVVGWGGWNGCVTYKLSQNTGNNRDDINSDIFNGFLKLLFVGLFCHVYLGKNTIFQG